MGGFAGARLASTIRMYNKYKELFDWKDKMAKWLSYASILFWPFYDSFKVIKEVL